MDYREALTYILSFADFERWPGAGYAERWDLRRMEELLERMASPHLNRKTIHIAGSKGKGSTAAMIASATNAAGYRTGLYTSPHLHTMRERIRIDGKLITEQEFAGVMSGMVVHIESTSQGQYGELSTFEILTGLAFAHFQKADANFQVLETGLGGKLDATNVVPKPDVCVITSISLDHTAVLGDTVAQIAAEKAGIIKPGVPVVCAPQAPEARKVIEKVCSDNGAALTMIGTDITWKGTGSSASSQSLEVDGLELNIPLLGEYQLQNAATAVAALQIAGISDQVIVKGLAATQWSGRIEVLQRQPLFVVDGAHNGDSAAKLVRALKQHFKYERSILIIGTSADKNTKSIVEQFAPCFDMVITTATEHPRANDPVALVAEFGTFGKDAQSTVNVREAVALAQSRAQPHDLICASGSLFLVAEVIENVKGIQGERYPKN